MGAICTIKLLSFTVYHLSITIYTFGLKGQRVTKCQNQFCFTVIVLADARQHTVSTGPTGLGMHLGSAQIINAKKTFILK